MSERAVRDPNRVPALIVVSNAADEAPVHLWADPTTHRLLVDASITTGLGAQTGVTDNEAVNAADLGVLILGTDGSNYQILAVNSSGHLLVDLQDTSIAVTHAALTELGDAINGSQVDVDIKASDVDLMLGTDFSNVLGTASVIGAGTEAGAIRVTVATDSTGVLSVDDNGASLTVDNAGLTALNGAISGTEVQVDIVSAPTITVDSELPAAAGLLRNSLLLSGSYLQGSRTL